MLTNGVGVARHKARHKVSVQEASVPELESLGYWYDLAGHRYTDIDGLITGALRTTEAGFLGSATGGRSVIDRLHSIDAVPRQDWYWGCTLILSIRVDDQTAGMLVIGAHDRLWKTFGEAAYGPAIHAKVSDEVYDKAEGEFVTTILSSSKLHMVAVDPAHRGRGHGRRLVNSAVDRLVKGGTVMIYGQFTGDRDLRGYYSSLGFDVLGKGEPLNMALATGKDIWLTAQPDDTMFVRHFRPRLPPTRHGNNGHARS